MTGFGIGEHLACATAPGPGLFPFILVAGASSLPCSRGRISVSLLALGAAVSALGNVALLGLDLFLFSGWQEVWGTQRSMEGGTGTD